MKAIEAIGQVDVLEPNQYSVEQKLKWLAVLDGQVFEELIRDYYEQAVKPGEYRTGEEELLIPMPYAQSIYCRYLQAMIAAENFESAKYNQQIVLYNAACSGTGFAAAAGTGTGAADSGSEWMKES